MNKVTIVGVALVIIGVLGIAGAATADHTGLNLTQPENSRDDVEFGWVQGVACAGGAMLALAGIAVAFVAVRRTRMEEEADMAEEIAAHEEQERKIEAYKASQAKKMQLQAQETEGQAVSEPQPDGPSPPPPDDPLSSPPDDALPPSPDDPPSPPEDPAGPPPDDPPPAP